MAFESRIAPDCDDRNVGPRRIAGSHGIGGIGVQHVRGSQCEGIGEVAIEERRVIEQSAQHVELDTIGLGGIEANGPLRRVAAGRDGQRAGTGR